MNRLRKKLVKVLEKTLNTLVPAEIKQVNVTEVKVNKLKTKNLNNLKLIYKTMADSNPTAGPNSAPETSENANVFGYNVASQVKEASAEKTNPNSPLAAG